MSIKRIVRTLALIVILVPVGAELALRAMLLSSVSQAATPSKAETQFERENRELIASFIYDDNGMTTVPDFHGTYFNVQDNRRVTTNQPAHSAHTLWLFGSSAVFGTFVADSDTVSSALQREVGQSYRVINMGMPAAVASKELRLLKKTPIQAGDLVIFYDGSQDIFAPYFGEANKHTLPEVCRTLAWSVLVSVVCSQSGPIVPSDDLVQSAYRQYATAIGEARAYTLAHGAGWLHVLQPTIFSQLPRADERALLSGMADSYAVTQPVFAAMPAMLDLTHSLDRLRSSGAVVYRDIVHVYGNGNAVIARAIAAHIAPTF